MSRMLSVVVLVVVLGLAACGDDDDPVSTGATPAVTATASSTPIGAPPATGPTGAVSPAQAQGIWPRPGAIAQDDPVAVARSFVEDYVGVEDPALSEFRLGEPRAGEVEVRRRGEGDRVLDTVVAVISLRQLAGDDWSVTSVQSDEVQLDTPESLDAVSSPLRVSGRGRGFEGNIVIEVRDAFATQALDQAIVTGGSAGALEPFTATLTFAPPASSPGHGAVLVKTGSGIAAADGFGAIPVRFAP